MNLKELKNKLREIKELGYIPSRRKGNTGVGYTFECLMDLHESNIAIPDVGGRYELKATRKHSSSLITLFTFNRGVWQRSQKEIIEEYGIFDENGRNNLYRTITKNNKSDNSIYIDVDKQNHLLYLKTPENLLLAKWNIYNVIAKFISKMDKVIEIYADTRVNTENREEFHYMEAYLLKEPSADAFLEAIDNSKVALDIRMHIKPNNSVRNHGTAFRIRETDLPYLFKTRNRLV